MYYIDMRLNKYLFCFFLLNFHFLFSQVVNIENKRNYDDTVGFNGSIDANCSAIKTKDLIVNLFLRPRVQYKSRNHYYLILSDLMYSKGADRIFSNLGMIHFQYAYRIKGPLKWENYYQVQYNQLMDQRSRMLLGSGLRLKCYDKKGYKIFLGSSVFEEREESESTGAIHFDMRMGNYISWYFDPKNHFFFSGVLYYQPLLSNFQNNRFLGQYSLNFYFTKRTDFKLEFTHIYASNPLPGVVKSTFNSSFGIRLKLGE